MKSIESIANHIGFNGVFSVCRNEDGKIDWKKVANFKDLPDDLILKYFFQLKNFNIEGKQELPEAVLRKYSEYINWPMLLKIKSLSPELSDKFFSVLKTKGMLTFLLAYGKYDYEMVVKYAADIVKVPNYRQHIISNLRIGNTGERMVLFLDSWILEHKSNDGLN